MIWPKIKMETKFEEHHCDENDSEEDEIVIQDFDDVFDFIGGWGPFQVNLLMFYPELIDALFPVPSTKYKEQSTKYQAPSTRYTILN